MKRLTMVELRRLFSRRFVVAIMLASLGVVALLLWNEWSSDTPISGQELAQAESFYQEQVADWEQNGAQHVADCRAAEATAREQGQQDVDFGCDTMGPPLHEWYVSTPPPLAEKLPGLIGNSASLLLLAAFLIGTTFVAAEFTTGAIGNWLTFEPRRLRVYLSKLTAVVLGVIPMTVSVVGLVTLGAWLINRHFGLATGLTAAQWTDTGWLGLRVLGLSMLAGLAGATLGFLLRHTAAVLGLGFGYMVVVEGIFANLVPTVRPWMLLTNIESWINHGASYYLDSCELTATGRQCQTFEHVLTFEHSLGFLLALGAAAVVLAALVFRRRDVT